MVLETISVQEGKVRVYHTDQERIWRYLNEFSGEQKAEKSMADLSDASRVENSDIAIKLEKGQQDSLLYIWQSDTGKKYLKNGEQKETTLEKEIFWKLLEGEDR